MGIERAAEQARESQYVVDALAVGGESCAAFERHDGLDLRIGIRQSEDDLAGAHELKRVGVLTGKETVVCLATAHWAKFTDAVVQAVGAAAAADNYPAQLKALAELPVRKVVVDATFDKVRQKMEEILRA